MADYNDEQMVMDAAIHDEHAGLILQVVGWTVLFFCSIPAMFLFIGWRSGSWLWFWVIAGLGTLGLGLVAGGGFLRGRAAGRLELVRSSMSSRPIRLRSEELPPEDNNRRVA